MSDIVRGRVDMVRGVVERNAQRVLGSSHMPMILDPHEFRLVISGLKRLRHQIKSDIARQKRDGWKPAPGHNDNNLLRLDGVNALLKRYERSGA